MAKRYLLAVKMFDVLFDSGENAAVAWHNYNLRPLKFNHKGGFYRLPDGYVAGPGGLLAHCPVRGPGSKGGRSRQSTFHPFRIAQAAQKISKREMSGSAGVSQVQCRNAQGTGTPPPATSC